MPTRRFRVQGLWLRVIIVRFRVQGLVVRFGVQGLGP